MLMPDKTMELLNNPLKSFSRLVKYLLSLACLEAQLAKQSLAGCVLLGIFLIALLSVSWLTVMALVFVTCARYMLRIEVSLGIILLINLIGMGIVITGLSQLAKNISFAATCRQLKKMGEI